MKSPEFPINGIQAVFQEIKGNLKLFLFLFKKFPLISSSHGYSCHVRGKGGGGLYSHTLVTFTHIHESVCVEKFRFIFISKTFKKNHKR
jgi:hypothetical protein